MLLLTSVDHPRAPGSRGCFTLSLLTTWVWVSMIMGVAPLRMDGIERPWESTTPWPRLTKTTTRCKASASRDGRRPADADHAGGWVRRLAPTPGGCQADSPRRSSHGGEWSGAPDAGRMC